MNSIRKRRNRYALLFAVSTCLTVWLGVTLMSEAAFAFGAVSVASLVFMVRQIFLLHDAALIWDNRILSVPSALIFKAGGKEKIDPEETVVSTFGILSGSKIYRWGLDGVHGVRLTDARIDRARLYLTFGDSAQTMGVELLHGMTEQQAVLDAAQKLWQETGVTASVIDWEHDDQGKGSYR